MQESEIVKRVKYGKLNKYVFYVMWIEKAKEFVLSFG